MVTAAAKGFSCAQTHWLKLISQTCALLQTGRSSPAGPKTSGSVKRYHWDNRRSSEFSAYLLLLLSSTVVLDDAEIKINVTAVWKTCPER